MVGKSSSVKTVDFNDHFHIFDEGRKWVPYYYLYFEASIEPSKLKGNAPCPIVWNETAAEKFCFLVVKKAKASTLFLINISQ